MSKLRKHKSSDNHATNYASTTLSSDNVRRALPMLLDTNTTKFSLDVASSGMRCPHLCDVSNDILDDIVLCLSVP